MTITNGYATLVEIKASDVLNIANNDHDTVLEATIEGVSRAIDNYCGRRIYAASETRYYTAENGTYIAVDDVAATASFAVYTDDDGDGTYENTWADTDYNLTPYNALLAGLPYTAIEVTPLGNFRFPSTRKGVKVVGSFGYAASTPKVINRVCILQSVRLFKRYVTPLGVAGSTAVGVVNMTIPALDPDVTILLRPFLRME